MAGPPPKDEPPFEPAPRAPRDTPSEPDLPPLPETDKTAQPHTVLDIAVSYGLAGYSKEVPVIHGGRVGVAAHLDKRTRFFLAYRLQMPFQVKTELLQIELFTHPLEVGSALECHWNAIYLRVGAYLLLDWVTWKITTRDEGVSRREDQLNLRIAAAPSAMIGWQPVRLVMIYVEGAADIFLYPNVFYYKENGENRKLVDPWTVSPYIQLGVRLFVFGKGKK